MGSELTSTDGSTFVEYVPPPPTPVPPPAKYKLWIIVLTLVFFAAWFAEEAGLLLWIQSWGILSPDLSFFVMLGIIVFCLTYAALDLLVACFTWTIRGKTYGLGPWLRQPRVQWIHKFHNFPAEVLAIIVTIFEDGFQIFNAPPSIKIPVPPAHYMCKNETCKVVLRIEHNVDPHKFDDYAHWEKKIGKVVRNFEGFEALEHLKRSHAAGAGGTLHEASSHENDCNDSFHGDAEDGVVYTREINKLPNQTINVDDADMEEGQQENNNNTSFKGAIDSPEGLDGPSHVVYISFSNIDTLNEYMASSRRRKLMNELEPLLLKPDVVKIQHDRVLPDAFTELLTRQGEAVPTLPPKKWKVAWLTTVALYICQIWTQQFLPYYFAFWKLDRAHPRVQSFVTVVLSTFLNSYVLTPLFLFLFNDWVRRKPNEGDNRQPWKTLSDGIQWMWLKCLVFLALYGGCVIVWMVKR